MGISSTHTNQLMAAFFGSMFSRRRSGEWFRPLNLFAVSWPKKANLFNHLPSSIGKGHFKEVVQTTMQDELRVKLPSSRVKRILATDAAAMAKRSCCCTNQKSKRS